MSKLTALVEAAAQTASEPNSKPLRENFFTLASPATILELCALLEKAEFGLRVCLGAILEMSPCMADECKQEQTEAQAGAERFGNEALTAIKQWKEMK